MSRTALALLLVGGALVPSGDAVAQSRFQVRGLVSVPGVERAQPASTAQLNGTTIGLSGAFRFSFLELAARYMQGSIKQSQGSSSQDLVEGELQIRARPLRAIRALRGFWVGFGPHARSYVEGGTERWLIWEARAGLDAWLLSGSLTASLELALGVAGSVNSGVAFGSASGVEGGVDFRIPRTPLFVGIAYRVDQMSLEGDSRTDTVEHFLFRAGFGR
jgi:hypothetical protein